jgi:hypothetical protein
VAGSQPRWQFTSGGPSLSKGAVYLRFVRQDGGQFRYEQTLGFVGEYHGQEVNREFISLQGQSSIGNRFWFSNAIEGELNRSWRKERAGKSLTISNIYLSTSYRFSRALRTGLSYDSRKNYWTYEQRKLSDSFFDNHIRQGMRFQLDVMPGYQVAIASSLGYRKRAGDPKPTYSYSVNMTKSGLILSANTVGVSLAGFSGPYEHGHNLTAQIGQNFGSAGSMTISYGLFLYSVSAETGNRSSRWIEFSGQANITSTCFFSGLVQHNTGDDVQGNRFQAELGYRF